MLPKKHSPVKTIVKLFFIVFFAAIAAFIILNRQYVIDQINVWEYKPTSQITDLITRAGMNSKGKFLYYASQPKIDGTSNFNQECDRIETTTAILGCYVNYKIYVYNVTDTQLDGIMEVTAAHETLHAAYQRLSTSQRTNVDKLLEQEYTKLENDPDYKARMDFYAKTEPGQRDNELHSVIGTEVANLSPALENYYKQYFTNRQDVVSLSEKYKSVFDNLTSQQNALSTQLSSLSASIKLESTSYNTQVTALNADIQTFNTNASNDNFSSQADFDSQRDALTARVNALSTERASINADISSYNTKLAQYNAIASQSKTLYNSIDSTLAPSPSV